MPDRIVYSTDGGDQRSRAAGPKGPPPGSGRLNQAAGKRGDRAPRVPLAPADGVVRVWRQKGGRGGKEATVITGLGPEAARLATELRKALGVGGALRDGAVELQGDVRVRAVAWLEARDYRVKLAGG
jgi:translation initiation factor 1